MCFYVIHWKRHYCFYCDTIDNQVEQSHSERLNGTDLTIFIFDFKLFKKGTLIEIQLYLNIIKCIIIKVKNLSSSQNGTGMITLKQFKASENLKQLVKCKGSPPVSPSIATAAAAVPGRVSFC